MIKQLITISKETIIYGFGSAAGGIVTFFLLPLYTKYLTPADYGYLAIFTVTMTIVQVVAMFGLTGGLFRYYLMAKDAKEKKTAISTVFWVQIFLILFLASILIPCSFFISNILFSTNEYWYLFIIIFLASFIGALNAIPFALLRAEHKPVFYSSLQISKVIVLALANIYFIVVLNFNFKGVILGTFIAEFFISLILIPWFIIRFKHLLSFRISRVFLKRLLKFVTPVFITGAFYLLINFSDRFFQNHFLKPSEVGIYSFAYNIGSIVFVGLISPFSAAFIPYCLSIAKNNDFKIIYARIVKYFFFFMVGISLMVFYFSKEVIILLSNSSYYQSVHLIGFFLLSNIFYGMYIGTSIPATIMEKTYLNMYGIILAAIISIVLNFLLIPIIGINGSAIAYMVSYFCYFICTLYFAQRNFLIKYDYRSILRFSLITIVYVLIYFLLNYLIALSWLNILIKLVVLLFFPFLLFLFRIFDINEKDYLHSTYKSLKNKFK